MTDPNPRTPAINPEHVQSKTIGTLLAPILAALGLDHTSPDYAVLVDALLAALEQATCGKGKERHAHGRDFTDQPILVIPRLLGDAGVGFLVGQAMKKAEEALLLPHERKLAELRGAVNYLLAATIHIVECNLASHPDQAIGRGTLHDHRPGHPCPVLGCRPLDHDHRTGFTCPVHGCHPGGV